MRPSHRRLRAVALLAVAATAAAACGSSKTAAPTTTVAATTTTAAATTTQAPATTAGSPATTAGSTATTAGSTATTGAPPTTGAPETTAPSGPPATGVTTGGISDAESAANKAVGKITYVSSFDYSASASIVDVLVAKKKGYFDKMCLDVELQSGFSTANYPLVAAGTAQFSSAGNYTEILNNSGSGASFVALVDYGKIPIEALITPDGGATKIEDLKGKTIGVKGDLPPSIVALLAKHGLKRGSDYKELLLDGFDPVAQLKSGIDALPVYKSNEPGQLDAAGVKYNLFDPADDSIPGSFGIIYTSKDFATKNPTATEDFVRAALHGMEDALADIPGAVQIAVDDINANGNKNFLTQAGELYRWTQESKTVLKGTPSGEPVGLIHPDQLDAEYQAYVTAGVWPKGAPDDVKAYDPSFAAAAYGKDGKVIWPTS